MTTATRTQRPCPTCRGSGQRRPLRYSDQGGDEWHPCRTCDGTGLVPACPHELDPEVWEELTDGYRDHFPTVGPGSPPLAATHVCPRCGAWGQERWINQADALTGMGREDVPVIDEMED